MSNAGKGSLSNTYFEWQNDSLAAAAANDQLEGDEQSFSAPVATLRLSNYAQISSKNAIVSKTLDAVNKAGRKSEMAYQLSKKSAELKRDMEFVATQNAAARAGNSTTSRRSAGLESFLSTATAGSNGGGAYAERVLSGTTEGYPSTAPVDGTQRAFTETILKDALADAYANGGKGSVLMLGPAQKQVASGFAGIAANRYVVEGESQGKIIGGADAYVGDFGVVRLVPNRFQRNRTGFVLDFEHVSIDYLRPFSVEDLAKTGDAEKKMIVVEWGLRVNHEGAHAKIADLT
jgi:hypothetical protein